MAVSEFTFSAQIWIYEGPASWHFVSLSVDISKDVKAHFHGASRGWGSLPVNVSIGNTIWKTSIFPDSKKAMYILPLKADIRKKEQLVSGQEITCSIEIKI
ncbi:MAG: DUF1905 domain-containing protein [Candidatus Gracilibacteria bacterium]